MISVIIPTRKINDCIRKEIIPALKSQTYQNFELILVPDKYEQQELFPDFAEPHASAGGGDALRSLGEGRVKVIPSWPKTGPGDKRDLAVLQAQGDIVAFTDDDAYPASDWLANAVHYFENEKIAAVCGPGITPPTDGLAEKVSSWVWGSTLGAGGIGTHRCRPEAKRELDDFPSFNLIVRKSDFEKVSGFNTYLWPGEDTKLCHKLVYELGKKIIYDPKVLVYHHRRAIFIPHLIQIARYGLHRGYFARVLPKTSRRLGYFMPTVFTVYLLSLLLFFWGFRENRGFREILFVPIALYFSLLLATAVRVYRGERNLKGSLLLIPAIFTTHIVYGIMFAKGFLSRELKE